MNEQKKNTSHQIRDITKNKRKRPRPETAGAVQNYLSR